MLNNPECGSDFYNTIYALISFLLIYLSKQESVEMYKVLLSL